MAIDDAAPAEVIGGDLDGYSIAFENADAKAAHLARDFGEHGVVVPDFYPERRIPEYFGYRSFELECFFLRHFLLTGLRKRTSLHSAGSSPAQEGTTGPRRCQSAL